MIYPTLKTSNESPFFVADCASDRLMIYWKYSRRILCTDKTLTLTQHRIVLQRHLDPYGEESENVLK